MCGGTPLNIFSSCSEDFRGWPELNFMTEGRIQHGKLQSVLLKSDVYQYDLEDGCNAPSIPILILLMMTWTLTNFETVSAASEQSN